MCSVITVNTKAGDLRRRLPELFDPQGYDNQGISLRSHGFLKKESAPVVFLNADKKITVEYKFFSLCPSWSKQWPFPFETYNARLSRPKKNKDPITGEWKNVLDVNGHIIEEYIYSVPSFRDAINTGQTCLVPISGAVESCYFGLSAGHVVRFCPKDDSVMFALGIWNDWINPISGEIVPTFTLLTDAPDPFVFRHGHDRGVIAVDPAVWNEWLDGRTMNGRQRLLFAREKRILPQWRCETERELKSGWQRRAPSQSEIDILPIWQPLTGT